MVTAREVRELLDERPELEPAVEAVLDADDPFTFDDLDIDSGSFGEVVSAGIAEQTENGYTVVNRDAVRSGLSGNVEQETRLAGSTVFLPTVDRRAAASLGAVVLFVIVMRLVSWPAVFRDGVVVLSSNDPYFYRYWVEQLLLNPETSLGTLPGGVTSGEPLLVVTLWAVTMLLGGTSAMAGQVMAWYPIMSAAVTALLLYLLAVEVTEDRRVGLAAVALLAIVPGHAMRTSLGFADHHAFDYPWLVLTVLSLVVLASASLRSRRTVLSMFGLGIGIAGQTLAWDASPLLLVPLGLAIALWSVIAVHQGDGPAERVGPAMGGVAVGAVVVWLAHTSLGWHTTVVASAPLLIFLGGIAVLGAAELAHRFEIDTRVLLVGEIVIGLGGLALLTVLRPEFWARLNSGVTDRLLREGNIAETQNLFGPSFGWLLLFGFVLVLAVPYLAWATRKVLDDARWAPPIAYGWYLLLLASIQIRFVGELATFASLFAGLGFVHLAERIDVSRPPVPFDSSVDGQRLSIPDRTQIGALVALFLLVGGLGIVQVPIKTNQLTISEEQYETATWMEDYSEEHDWEYPQNYVFSQWSYNRLYNYFVSGESRTYGFAQQQYEPFVTSRASTDWYRQLRDRAGFVVYETGTETPPGSIGERLSAYGSRTQNASGLAHYRAVYVSDKGTYRVFTLVPGATITGHAEANTSVTLTTEVKLDDVSFTYERRVQTGPKGTYRVTVAYPGTYSIGDEKVSVSGQVVENGGNVSV